MQNLKDKIEKIEKVERQLKELKELKDVNFDGKNILPCLCFTNCGGKGHYTVEIHMDLFLETIKAQEKELNLSVEEDRRIVAAFELMLTKSK